jgi:hypothetical protein
VLDGLVDLARSAACLAATAWCETILSRSSAEQAAARSVRSVRSASSCGDQARGSVSMAQSEPRT